MKKILLSIGILAAVIAVVAGATGAWFTNTETSTGNTFTAGVIDLKIDNESYVTNNDGVLVASPETSWEIKDLDEGELFFNFNDLKPGDVGEDTISLHVGSNDAWACMDINITETPENGQTEPEAIVDGSTGPDDGELQKELEFVFWKDDGDNVLEEDEVRNEDGGIFWNMTLQEISDGGMLALADSEGGVLEDGSPLQGGETYYIGKAWCHGELEISPLNPYYEVNGDLTIAVIDRDDDRGPLERGTGITCDGYPITDISQTDGVVADVSFSVEQSRHNDNFLCNPPEEGELTVVKLVRGGDTPASQFALYVDGSSVINGETNTFSAGPHTVSEASNPNYVASFSGACDSEGDVTVPANESVTCTITNTYTKGNLTVIKIVEGGPYANDPNFFDLRVDGAEIDSGDTITVSAGLHTVSEDQDSDYTQSFSGDCDEGGNVNVPASGSVTCTITNTYTLGTLTVNKIVVGTMGNDDDLTAGDFNLYVNDIQVSNGGPEVYPANTLLTITEDGDDRYTALYSGACDGINEVTLVVGEDATCTITNTYNRGTLTVDKEIMFTTDNSPVAISDFILHVEGPNGYSADFTDDTPVTDLEEGLYTVTETYIGDDQFVFEGEFGVDCTDHNNPEYGEVTLTAGDDLECRLTNREQT